MVKYPNRKRMVKKPRQTKPPQKKTSEMKEGAAIASALSTANYFEARGLFSSIR